MKKYYFFFAALLAVAQMSAQSPDTVTVIDNPQQVIITETPTGSVVRVMGAKNDNEYNYTYQMEHAANDSIHISQDRDWELNFPFQKNKNKDYHWSIESKGLYFGGGLHTSNSMVNNVFNWGFLQILGVNYRTLHGQHFSLGVGYDSKRFSLKRPNCFVMDENTKVVSTDIYPDVYPNEISKRSSILNVRAIQFPLLFQQDISKDFRIVLGATMNWNVYAKCNTHYKVNTIDYDITYHNIKQNKLTFDVLGTIGWEGLSVYCRYSPSNMFKKGYGPEIKETWTLGVAIGL